MPLAGLAYASLLDARLLSFNAYRTVQSLTVGTLF